MKHIVGKEYLCFDALLEIIIGDINSEVHLTQVDFAELFGITVPIGTETSIKNVQYSSDITKCGTTICPEKINIFFKNNSIPLKLSYIPSCYFDEITFGDMVFKKSSTAYIVFAFCYGLLYNEPPNNNVGHVALFEAIDNKMDTIQIYDPGPRNHGSKNVKVDDLVYAMKKRGGMYLFEKVYS